MDVQARNGAADDRAEELAERGSPVVFEEKGFRLLGHRRGALIRYRDVTHIAHSRRAVAIGTVRDAVVLRRHQFADRDAMVALPWALIDRIGRQPGGELQLARMAELDQLARSRGERRAIYGFVVVCLAALAVQWRDPFVTHVGSFMPELVAGGELWRVLTANFLHDMYLLPFHLGLNLLCIVVIGLLVERALGSWRTVVVMGVSGLAAMYGCVVAGYPSTVGASGVAAGLAGALLCIELRGSRRLPVWWRIPRRIFIGAVIAQAALDLLAPFIAGAAHLGGFVAGYAVTRLFVADALLRRPVGRGARLVGALLIAGVLVSSVAVGPLVRRDGAALERHGLRLLQSEAGNARSDNELAWVMVTESQPSEIGVQVAAALAERAVRQTNRSNPDLLDTLAEVLFVAGDIRGALLVIDEAIEISPGDPYFVEQRRRFTGERDPDDRPSPPTEPWILRAPRQPGPDAAPLPERDGLAV